MLEFLGTATSKLAHYVDDRRSTCWNCRRSLCACVKNERNAKNPQFLSAVRCARKKFGLCKASGVEGKPCGARLLALAASASSRKAAVSLNKDHRGLHDKSGWVDNEAFRVVLEVERERRRPECRADLAEPHGIKSCVVCVVCAMCAVCCVLCAVCCMLCAVCCVLFAVCCVLCVLCTVLSASVTLCCVLCRCLRVRFKTTCWSVSSGITGGAKQFSTTPRSRTGPSRSSSVTSRGTS